jgi:predicted phosphoribosyltransferase
LDASRLVVEGVRAGAWIRRYQPIPAKLVLAVPVAPSLTCYRLNSEVDEMVCLERPQSFYGVGQFYGDFSQVSDEKVTELLDRSARQMLEKQYSSTVM